jgi:small-conductance mechanosensitive channel
MVGISYADNIENAISVIKNEIKTTMPFVLQMPEPEFRVEELGDSSVNIQVLVWHPKDDWSQAQPILLTTIKRALDKSGIEIPFPQRVVWDAKN